MDCFTGSDLLERWASRVDAAGPWTTVDSHTAGEGTRLVVGGVLGLERGDMSEKRRHIAETQDHLRRSLLSEPRGHRDLLGAVLTPPVSPEAAFGLVYMDARRYPYLCGHATIGAVTTWLELGPERPPDGAGQPVLVDTPSGLVRTEADVCGGRVTRVALQPEAALAHTLDQALEVPDLGRIEVDLVLAGGFFVMVDADRLGLPLDATSAPRLAELGMKVIQAANQAFEVRHPTRPYIDTVDVASFYGRAEGGGRNAVVYGEAHVDRSPCGTGTCARLALEHARARLEPGVLFVNRGPMGTSFDGEIVGRVQLGGRPAVQPRVASRAFVTGVHRFYAEPTDPFRDGFLLGR